MTGTGTQTAPLTVGFVCEGPTDVAVLAPLVAHAVGAPIVPVYLQPSHDALDGWGHGGDTRVEQWCKQYGFGLEWLLSLRQAGAIELLVIQLDADRCPKHGAADTAALCQTIKGWLGAGAQRPEVLIVLPSQATEAWLVAAYQNPTPELEAQPHPEDRLAKLKKLARHPDGTPHKDPSRYGPMAAHLLTRLDDLRPTLTELDRFMCKLDQHPAVQARRPQEAS